MNSEVRTLPHATNGDVCCAHCYRLFMPLRLLGVAVARFCSVTCAEAGATASRSA